MSDVNANINISIDSSQALAQLRALQNQISDFNKSVVAGNVAAAQAQRDLTRNLVAQINATKQFTTSITGVESSVSRLGRAIDKNKLSLGEYFRYGVAASGMFGRSMKEHARVMDLARERVKRLQTQYIALEEAHNGYTRSLAVRPTNLFNADTAIAIQRQQIFNKLLGDGSTALVNWGKNTQWAGRQLMVGFTVPLTIFGGMAGKIFMDLEKQVVQFKRVYGDLSTPTSERNAMVEEIKMLGKEFTKYGITVSDTVALAAKAAATGATGADLIAQTTEATRLATLGQIDYQQALDATISLQTAFGISSGELADATNFLNAVENQTVTSLDDITSAIPLVAPVIKGLGGDVQDLAIFMTAMREGGISANEGANALKSGLASLINPTKAAREQLAAVGINIDAILSKNKGDLRGLVTEFGMALGTLGKFERQQTLAKMFGKYQFARLGALFANISKDGSQASRVIDLTAMSTKELGQIAEGELGQLEQAVGVKFTAAVEKLKLAIAPIGEAFLKIATPIIEWVTKIADKFNELPDAAKTFITWGAAIGGVLIPTVIMLVGLLGNFAGNMLKIGAAIGRLMGKTTGLGSDLEYLTMEELDAMAAAASLESQTTSLTGALNIQKSAVIALAKAYGSYVAAAGAAAANLPQGFRGRGPAPIKMATGGLVPGTGNGDTIPALLTPGESVINKEATQKFGPILQAMNSGTIPGFVKGQIDIGNGEMIDVDFRSVEGDKSSFAAVQRLFDSISEDAVDAKEAFRGILRDLQTAEGVTAEQVKKLLRETEHPELRRIAGGTRASYPGTESPEVQLARQTTMSADEIKAEVRVAQVSADGASKAVSKWAAANRGLIEQLGYDAESFVVESNIARAHTQRVEKGAGIAAWHANFWQMQSQAENQFIETGLKQSERNQQFLMKYLGSQEEAEALMKRLVSGVALTEDEYDRLNAGLTKMLQAVQTTPEILKGVSPTFLKQAIGAKGAIEARRAAGLRYADPRSLAGMTEAELAPLVMARTVASTENSARDVAESHSNAEAFARVGDDIDGGLAEGITRSTPVVTAAAERLTETTKSTVATGAKDISKEFEKLGITGGATATTPRSVVMQIEAEKEARQEALKRKAVEASINKEIQRRQMLLVRSGIPAQAALEIARKEVLAEKEQLAIEQEILETKQKQSQVPVVPPNAKMLPIVPSGATPAGTEIQQQSGVIARGVKSFGQALTKGSAKLMGASFALDGLVFGLSMMNNGVGEFAQKIMPAVFALQGVQMMLPLLANPIGATVAALVAVGAGLWMLNKQADNVRARGKQLADAMYGTTKSMNDTAAFFERKTWDQRLAQTQVEQVTGEKQVPETIQRAQSYLESDAGKTLFENVKATLDTLGSEKAATALKNNLERMMLSGAIAPEMGSAIASQISEQLGNKKIGIDAITQIIKIVGPNGENLKTSEDRLKIVADIVGDATDLTYAFEQAGLLWDGSNWIAQAVMIVKGQGTADLFSDIAAQESINKLTVYQNELDRINAKWNEGKLSAKSYQEQVNAIFNQKQLVSYQGMLDQAKKLYGDQFGATQINNLGQTIINSLMNNINASLGEKAGKNFLDGLQSTVNDGIDTWDVNLLNPDQVSSSIEVLLSEGQKAAADTLQQQYNAVMNLSLQISSGAVDPSVVENLLNNGVKPVDIIAKLAVQYEDPAASAIYSMALGVLKPDDILFNAVVNYLDNGLTTEAGKIVNMALRGQKIGINVDMEFNALGSSIQEIETRISQVERFDALAAKKSTPIKRLVNFASENFDLVTSQIDGWAKLSDLEKKKRVMLYVDAYLQLRQQFTDSGALEQTIAGLGSNVTREMGGREGVLNYMVQNAATTQTNNEFAKSGSSSTTSKPTGAGGGGGGGTKEDPYGDWWKALIEKLKTFTNINKVMKDLGKEKNKFEKALPQLQYKGSLVDQMRKAGLSEMMIADLLSKGYDAAKKIFDTLKKKGKLKVADLGFTVAGVANVTSELLGENRMNRKKIAARKNLETEKVPQEVIDKILESEYAVELYSKAVNKNTGEWKDNIAAAKSVVASNEELRLSTMSMEDALSNVSNVIDSAFSAMENQIRRNHQGEIDNFEAAIKSNEKIIDQFQTQINLKQEQINDYEHLNDLDQQSIDNYNRDIEMQNRKIQNLQREDDIRQRVASALQHELDILSRQEQSIRDAYQKRMDALDQIAKLNERILQSQQDQLGVAKALSEGDVYAAAAAAAQMQQNSVQYAAEQNRNALQQGMENQISGLTTANGMTRAQAEAQIQAIQDQSYQTSLQIRDIEDYIYNLKQTKILPLEDSIYQRNLLIRDLNNEIYDINEVSIEPLKLKNDEYQKSIDKQNEMIDNEINMLILGKMTKEEWEARKDQLALSALQSTEFAKALDVVKDKYEDIANAARDASKWIEKATGIASPITTPTMTTSGTTSNGITANTNGTYTVSNGMGGVMTFKQVNGAWVPVYRGGMIKKYSVGSVVGDGSRDSVPSMLTPGEYVIRKSMVDKYGLPMFNKINQGSFKMPTYGADKIYAKDSATFNERSGTKEPITVTPVYNNYSVNVSANTNATPDDIANTVINKIRSIDNMAVRRINGY